MDIAEFYAADERRRSSKEVEYGRDWHDPAGNRYELTWVEGTGEIYLMLEPDVGPPVVHAFGDWFYEDLPPGTMSVAVIGRVPGREALDAAVAGWETEMKRPDGVAWVLERLRDAGLLVGAA